jgi:hypothetical protein
MKRSIYILIFLLGSLGLSAQKIEVNASIDTNFILIGEQTQIELSITYRVDEGEINIQFPQHNDTINKFIEILSKSEIDTLIPDKDAPYLFQQKQQIIITSFDSGYYVIPPFQFVINNDTLETEPLLIEVQTIEIDTTEAIFDVKAPLEEPFSFIDWLKENWMWIAGTLALIIAIIAFIIYLKKKKPQEIIVQVKPEIPPHVIALERLEDIERQKLWQEGKVKQYHSEISEIIRNYIELRYQINALEETTSEIIHGLRLHGIDTQLMTKLNQTLVLADLVKFAKEKPLPNENEMSIKNAIEFVNNTKIIKQKNAE